MVNNQVESTLRSLDGIRRATAEPFLYHKIQQQIEAGRGRTRINSATAWRLAAVCLVLVVLNIISWTRLQAKRYDKASSAFQQLYGDYIYSNSIYGD